MNTITTLFLNHLLNSRSAGESLHQWVSDLEACDDTPDGTKDATFRFMAAITNELHGFMASVDIYAAVFSFQEDPHQRPKSLP